MNTLYDITLHETGVAIDLKVVLERVLCRVVERGGLAAGSIRLTGITPPITGTLVAERTADRAVARWEEEAARFGDSSRRYAASPVAAILHGGQPMGAVWLAGSEDSAGHDRVAPLTQALARHCAFLIQRHATRHWMQERLGRPWLLAGMSPGMRALDAFIERAAASRLPVLLQGEFGTETTVLAAAVHACGPWRDGPFVMVSCAAADGMPSEWVERAAGGSLLLNDVDMLPPDEQHRMAHLLAAIPATGVAAPQRLPARIIAITAADLPARVREGRFCRRLLAGLDYLSATVPPLRERRDDMQALLAAALDRHGHRPEERLSDELVALCRAHHWPDNLSELDRAVARLAVMAAGPLIGRDDVARHTPWLIPAATPDGFGPSMCADGAAMEVPVAETEPGRPPEPGDLERWVVLALAPDPVAVGRLHPALRKALAYLGRAYAEPVSMAGLAHHAHVSASHLGFLFRTELGVSFKALLTHIRVHKAKEILRTQPRLPVTEAALLAGFADLSHFERSFRRIVGHSPRMFRRGS